MTKPPSIKTADFEQYQNLDLHQLEAAIKDLRDNPPTPDNKRLIRAVQQVLRSRLRFIKSKVMAFEQTNHNYLLVFDSTDNFSKIAGHSVLFYAFTIAGRLHRRYYIKPDTDDYYRSEDGIISIRSLKQLIPQLAEINIFPDLELSTTELHFFALPTSFSDEELAKLRDQSSRDVARISSIILPDSPVPDLYQLILKLNRDLYQNCRHVPDHLARETILRQIMLDANAMVVSYLNFANAKSTSGIIPAHLQQVSDFKIVGLTPTSAKAQNLLELLLCTRSLRNNTANLENLHLFHRRELRAILEQIVEIERLATHEYTKQLRLDHAKNQQKSS